jgi:hypothetical protein
VKEALGKMKERYQTAVPARHEVALWDSVVGVSSSGSAAMYINIWKYGFRLIYATTIRVYDVMFLQITS